MIKWILSILVFLISLAVAGFIGFYTSIFLIGPHSDILPDFIHIPVGIILLTTIIGIPFWLARLILNHLKDKEKNNLSK